MNRTKPHHDDHHLDDENDRDRTKKETILTPWFLVR
jgi:hypothetical protein